MSKMKDEFINNTFRIRECYKYKGKGIDICECGRKRDDHRTIPILNEIWSYANNTELRPCDNHGKILFKNYENELINESSEFIRFNYIDEDYLEAAVYKLLIDFWKFPEPQLVISVNGGYKRMNFKTNQQKKNFKQGLIEVMKTGRTWIIGGGFNVGIHKLIGEAVYDYRLLHDGNENQVKLIGISTWGVVKFRDRLSSRKSVYTYSGGNQKGVVLLDSQYDCFLFCDDGTINQYGKETEFRLKFEKYIQNNVDDTFVNEILYEGGKLAIINVHKSLEQKIPLVVINGSGRAADIISQVLQLPPNNLEKHISMILKEFEIPLDLFESERSMFVSYLYNIYEKHKNQIVIHDIFDRTLKFDKKILEAIISSYDGSDLDNTLNLMIRFNCHDIAEAKIFQNPKYSELQIQTLEEIFKSALKRNLPEFVRLFLENDFEIDIILNKKILVELYRESMQSTNCRCADLLNDLILTEDKYGAQNDEKLLFVINKIIRKLSGNILKKTNILHASNDIQLRNASGNENLIIVQDLFLWAVLSGYTDMAVIFWKIGKDHISTALIGSIILTKMKSLFIKRGSNDISEKMSDASKKFQEMAIDVMTIAYEKSPSKSYILLIRTLEKWNNMTCLQIALSGKLLDFLNQSACVSYTRKAWMGELSPLLPMWKIIITIPFSCFSIMPLVIPTFHEKRAAKNTWREGNEYRSPEVSLNDHLVRQPFPETIIKVTFQEAIRKFYGAPFVKFIIHFVSYILFLVIFSYFNLVKLSPLTSDVDIKDISIEIFIYVYVFGIFIEELRQIYDQERSSNIHKLKAYISGSWNIYDVAALSLFLFCSILRFTLSNKYFVITRCFFAISFSMFCLRTLQFYLMSRYIGPKVIMIRNMIVDVLFFLSIFTLFIISYGTLAQTILYPNSDWDLPLIKSIFYNPYFQTYGELMLEEFNITSPCETATCIIQFTTVIIGFAVFLLFTHILLINLLIAMFGHTFNKIQGESEKIFSLIQIQLVEEFSEKPVFPPPLNIFYYFIKGFLYFGRICSKTIPKRQNTFLVKSLDQKENMKILWFEQNCMETAMLDTVSVTDNKKIPSQEMRYESNGGSNDTLIDENIYHSIRSYRNLYQTRLNSLEDQLENFKSLWK